MTTGLNDSAVSQLFLSGKGNRSYFDVRTIYYLGFSEADTQSADPGHPPGDRLQLCLRSAHSRRRARLPNQLHQSQRVSEADFDPITQSALN